MGKDKETYSIGFAPESRLQELEATNPERIKAGKKPFIRIDNMKDNGQIISFKPGVFDIRGFE